jgi:hypothetical protein
VQFCRYALYTYGIAWTPSSGFQDNMSDLTREGQSEVAGPRKQRFRQCSHFEGSSSSTPPSNLDRAMQMPRSIPLLSPVLPETSWGRCKVGYPGYIIKCKANLVSRRHTACPRLASVIGCTNIGAGSFAYLIGWPTVHSVPRRRHFYTTVCRLLSFTCRVPPRGWMCLHSLGYRTNHFLSTLGVVGLKNSSLGVLACSISRSLLPQQRSSTIC